VCNIGDLQKPKWQLLSSGSGCKGHSRIVFSLSAGGEHRTTLVSVSMDRQVCDTISVVPLALLRNVICQFLKHVIAADISTQ